MNLEEKKIETEIFSIIFRVDSKEYLIFKKHQFLLKIKEKKNVQESFSFLLERAKNKLEKENHYFECEESSDFLKNFTSISKKNLRIQNPKKIQIHITVHMKKIFQNVAYSIVKRNNVQDFSYYYAFKNILLLNDDLI